MLLIIMIVKHLAPMGSLDTAVDRVIELVGQKQLNLNHVAIAVVGGAAVGKTTVISPSIASRFPEAVVLSEDDYCIGNTASASLYGAPNLHVPSDYDPSRIRHDLESLKNGIGTKVPRYSFESREPLVEPRFVDPGPVIVMEGSYLLQPPLAHLFDIKLFVVTDDHSRFVRRMIRPRRNPNQADTRRLFEYFELAYPSYYREVLPFSNQADVIGTNTYSPAEALSRITPDDTTELDLVGEVCEYEHPNMTTAERLAVACLNGIQRVTYMPDRTIPNMKVAFSVPIDEYVIDLTKVGYSVRG